MRYQALVIAAAVLLGPAVSLSGQETSSYTANPLRLDLRPLGHPPLDVIPPGESAVTSLAIGPTDSSTAAPPAVGPISSSSTRSGDMSFPWATFPAPKASSTALPRPRTAPSISGPPSTTRAAGRKRPGRPRPLHQGFSGRTHLSVRAGQGDPEP